MNKKFILSLIIFFLTVGILGIPYINWGFDTDVFANIQHCSTQSFFTCFNFFKEGNIEAFCNPSNSPAHGQAFLSGLYRPMSFIYYLPQFYLFGTNAYGYFLVTIIFHAFNAVLLFLIFSNFISLLFAFLAALFFAFHSSLFIWLGWTSAQTYFIELFVLLLSLLALKKYLDQKSSLFYFLSCFLYLSNLFLKEATIIFPVWIVFAIYFYLQYKDKSENIFSRIKKSLLFSSGYWFCAAIYVAARLQNFPFTSNTSTFNFEPNLPSFLNRQKDRFLDLVTYFSDIFGLRFLPANSRLLKGTLILLIFTAITFLFFKNKKKSFALFLILSTLLFSWPMIIQCQPRYIYLAIPFFILLCIWLITGTKQNLFPPKYKNAAAFLFSLFLICIAILFVGQIKKREISSRFVQNAFEELLKNKEMQHAVELNHSLAFFDIPSRFHNATQAMWLLTGKSSYPVYVFGQLKEIPEKYLKENPLFITWDSKNEKFTIILSSILSKK